MNTTPQPEELIQKYNRNECTEAEQALVEQWLMDEHRKSDVVPGEQKIAAVNARMRTSLLNYIQPDEVKRPVKRSLWYKWTAAAAVLFFLSISFYLYQKQEAPGASTDAERMALSPAKKSATLMLADGRRILLNDASQGELAKEAGVKITKTANGEVVYEILGGQTQAKGATNTLSTAKGETYILMLPDKSKVWLNAASSLTYSLNFTAAPERRVVLKGEAYFEIAGAKDKHGKKIPFVVKTATQEVEVLGTHFSINSYTDEPAVSTTLMEGSVKVHPLNSNFAPAILKAGQQSLTDENGIAVKEVDTGSFIDWKNGVFIFKKEALPSIMRRVGRWYNADIEYPEGWPGNEVFEGRLSRFDQVNTVLSMLEETGDVQFVIKGRRILVYPKKN